MAGPRARLRPDRRRAAGRAARRARGHRRRGTRRRVAGRVGGRRRPRVARAVDGARRGAERAAGGARARRRPAPGGHARRRLVDAGARRRDGVPARATPLRVLSNRGANGIDGTLATAYGVAAASPGPVVLLTGDVALAHDAGSLLTARRIGVPLTIVLVDNGGGGISTSSRLRPGGPLRDARRDAARARRRGARAGIRAASAAGWTSPACVPRSSSGSPPTGPSFIHVRTDRAENVLLHRRMWRPSARRWPTVMTSPIAQPPPVAPKRVVAADGLLERPAERDLEDLTGAARRPAHRSSGSVACSMRADERALHRWIAHSVRTRLRLVVRAGIASAESSSARRPPSGAGGRVRRYRGGLDDRGRPVGRGPCHGSVRRRSTSPNATWASASW